MLRCLASKTLSTTSLSSPRRAMEKRAPAASSQPVPLCELVENRGGAGVGKKRTFDQMRARRSVGYVKGTIHRWYIGQCVSIVKKQSQKTSRTYWRAIFASRGASIGRRYAYGQVTCWTERDCKQKYKKGMVYRLYVTADYPEGGQRTMYLDIRVKRSVLLRQSPSTSVELLFPNDRVLPVGETLFETLSAENETTPRGCFAVRGVVVNASNIIARDEGKRHFVHFELAPEDAMELTKTKKTMFKTIRVTLHFNSDTRKRDVRRIVAHRVWSLMRKAVIVYPCRGFVPQDESGDCIGLSVQWKPEVIQRANGRRGALSVHCELSSVTANPKAIFYPTVFVNRDPEIARDLDWRPQSQHPRRSLIVYAECRIDATAPHDQSKSRREKAHLSITVQSTSKAQGHKKVAQIRATAYDAQLSALRRSLEKKTACWACLTYSESGGLVVKWVSLPVRYI